jgi:hypothetical protein
VTVIVGTIVVWGDVTTVVFWLTHPAVMTTATSKTIKRRYFIPVNFNLMVIYFSYIVSQTITTTNNNVDKRVLKKWGSIIQAFMENANRIAMVGV